jgi:hypothetical protein
MKISFYEKNKEKMGMQTSSKFLTLLLNWKEDISMAGFIKTQSRLRTMTEGYCVLAVSKTSVRMRGRRLGDKKKNL